MPAVTLWGDAHLPPALWPPLGRVLIAGVIAALTALTGWWWLLAPVQAEQYHLQQQMQQSRSILADAPREAQRVAELERRLVETDTAAALLRQRLVYRQPPRAPGDRLTRLAGRYQLQVVNWQLLAPVTVDGYHSIAIRFGVTGAYTALVAFLGAVTGHKLRIVVDKLTLTPYSNNAAILHLDISGHYYQAVPEQLVWPLVDVSACHAALSAMAARPVRDPFQPACSRTGGYGCKASPAAVTKTGRTRFAHTPLASLKLAGVITQAGKRYSLVYNDQGQTVLLRAGDYLGREAWQVRRIEADTILLAGTGGETRLRIGHHETPS